jgi:hypothetical protein
MVSLNLGAAETRFSDVNVDIRREAFKHTRSGNCVIADAGWLPFRAGTFNYIYASNVLEHLTTHPYDELNELGFICRLGGIIHVVSPPGNFKCCVIETVTAPFIIAQKIRQKKFKSAWMVLKHLASWSSRIKSGADTGFGGHRWFLPWGWKLFYKAWFPWELRGWKGIHVMYEAFYIKQGVSTNGEEYTLGLLKEEQLTPYPDKYINYNWY